MTTEQQDNSLQNITQPTMSMDALVENFIKVRDAIKAADDAHKAKLAPAKAILDTLNSQIVASLIGTGTDSAKTKNGTAYITTKKSASLEDPAEFRRFVIGGELWDMVDWKANSVAIEDFIKENDTPPPGVKYNTHVVAGVRRA